MLVNRKDQIVLQLIEKCIFCHQKQRGGGHFVMLDDKLGPIHIKFETHTPPHTHTHKL